MMLTSIKNVTTNKFIRELLGHSKTMSVQQRCAKLKVGESESHETQQADSDAKETPVLALLLLKKQVQKQEQQRRLKALQESKRRATNYVPGQVSLQVLGAGANGSPASVYLFTDQSRYLFNCGEGTQRLAHEHKTKLARLEHVFVTRNTWSMVGGFPGLALTVQDAGVRELYLHGPPHLQSILQSMKRFVVLKNLQVISKDCTLVQEFEDAAMTVKCVPLYRNENVATTETDHVSEKIVIAYICKLKPRPGALSLEKCVERGVPPGPLLGLLKNGMDITLDNGTVVKSRDVSEPGEKALSFLFIDIPSNYFLPALQARASQFHTDDEMALVVHFSPDNIVQTETYQEFVKSFNTETQHIYLNSSKNGFSGYIAAHRIQIQLNQLNPHVFPFLNESAHLCTDLKIISNELKKTKLNDNVDDAKTKDASAAVPIIEVSGKHFTNINSMTNFHLRPKRGLDRSVEAKLTPSEYIKETLALESFPELLEKLQKHLKPRTEENPNQTFPKITFLGTGSCIPNKTRNVSSILVQTNESAYILLDCGEGTLGQIIRFFGEKKAIEVVQNLRAIYVSHLHADHHIGLIGLLSERRRLLCAQQLLLLAPQQIETWLSFYDEYIEPINLGYELIGNGRMLDQPLQLHETHREMGVESVATCLVHHCPHSFGVSLNLHATNATKPIKVTYSGDTMPCADLIELGQNSTILIHEATMEDDLLEEAKAKMHSTISQAIAQGNAMAAEHIILTHFSQRYAKLPRIQSADQAEKDTMNNVSIAFDNMQLTMPDLQQFHLMYPALRALFAEHAEELEQKALKREIKLERKRKLLIDAKF